MTRHPNKHINAAMEYAADRGWTFKISNGHAFGRIKCQFGCCIESVWSTPKVPENHAKHLRRSVDACPGARRAAEEAQRAADQTNQTEEGNSNG